MAHSVDVPKRAQRGIAEHQLGTPGANNRFQSPIIGLQRANLLAPMLTPCDNTEEHCTLSLPPSGKSIAHTPEQRMLVAELTDRSRELLRSSRPSCTSNSFGMCRWRAMSMTVNSDRHHETSTEDVGRNTVVLR